MFQVSRVTFDPNDVHNVFMGEESPIIRGVRRLGRRCEASAKRRCPVDTGRLRQSIGHKIDVHPMRVHLDVYAATSYATYVHEGTGPVIRPKNSKALKFDVGGETVFATHVRGMKGRPFIESAVRDEIARL